MKAEAVIRITIAVPFDAKTPAEPKKDADAAALEDHRTATSKARVAAAKHAESELTDKVAAALGKYGKVLSRVVEEVREA